MVNTGIIKTLLVACALVAALAPATVQGLGEIRCTNKYGKPCNLEVMGGWSACNEVVTEMNKVDGISGYTCVRLRPTLFVCFAFLLVCIFGWLWQAACGLSYLVADVNWFVQ